MKAPQESTWDLGGGQLEGEPQVAPCRWQQAFQGVWGAEGSVLWSKEKEQPKLSVFLPQGTLASSSSSIFSSVETKDKREIFKIYRKTKLCTGK